MLILEDIEKAITAAAVAAFNDVPIIFTNQDDTSLSEGTASWIKFKVNPANSNQLQLGDNISSRELGVLVFIIYIRKGQGTLERDRLYKRVLDLYRNKMVGGATFKGSQPLLAGNNENWFVAGYQIPFYFDSI